MRGTLIKERKTAKVYIHGQMAHTIKDFTEMILSMGKENIKLLINLIGKEIGFMVKGKDQEH